MSEMSHSPVEPTGSCFDDSMQLLLELYKVCAARRDEFRLVHACCAMDTGQQFAHAWVEDPPQAVAIFTAIQDGERRHFVAPQEEFHAHFNVADLHRYAPLEAFALAIRHGHHGPWVLHLKQLCRQGETP